MAPGLGAAEMPLQPLELLLGLDLAQRVLDDRQQPLGREIVDQLRLGLVEAGGAQRSFSSPSGSIRGCGDVIAQASGASTPCRARRRWLDYGRRDGSRRRLRLAPAAAELALELEVGLQQLHRCAPRRRRRPRTSRARRPGARLARHRLRTGASMDSGDVGGASLIVDPSMSGGVEVVLVRCGAAAALDQLQQVATTDRCPSRWRSSASLEAGGSRRSRKSAADGAGAAVGRAGRRGRPRHCAAQISAMARRVAGPRARPSRPWAQAPPRPDPWHVASAAASDARGERSLTSSSGTPSMVASQRAASPRLSTSKPRGRAG